MSIDVKISGLDASFKKLDSLTAKLQTKVSGELDSFGLRTVNDAKRLCPVDEGHLRNSITYARGIKQKSLTVEIIVAANYAAYIEFGTRSFAANYVASLPSDWQTFAAQFKGSTGGSFEEMVKRITDWVHRKGITGTYSVKTHKRTGNKAVQVDQDKQAAYRIALYLIRHGIKPHPFLVPAVEKNKKELIENLKVVLK